MNSLECPVAKTTGVCYIPETYYKAADKKTLWVSPPPPPPHTVLGSWLPECQPLWLVCLHAGRCPMATCPMATCPRRCVGQSWPMHYHFQWPLTPVAVLNTRDLTSFQRNTLHLLSREVADRRQCYKHPGATSRCCRYPGLLPGDDT